MSIKMIMKVLVFLLGLTCALGSLKKICPPPESIPCDCRIESRIGPSIYCSWINDVKELKRVLDQLQGYYIERLHLDNVNISSFSENLFNNLHIRELSLFHFEVQDDSFQSNDSHLLFQGLETSLTQLEINRSFRHSQIKHLKLDHMKALVHIDFDTNIIPEIGNDWFLNGPKNLRFLFFVDNGIKKLGDRAFQSLEGLSILVFRGNIKTISRSMLPSRANYLIVLDFKDNKLSEFPSDIFSNMPSLEEVSIRNNLFYTIQQDAWSIALPKLIKVSLQGNNLICDDSLKWVCNYRTDVIHGNCLAPVDYRDCIKMIMKVIVLLLGLICCALGNLKRNCPPPESISCDCRIESDTGPRISCSWISDIKVLERILDQLQGYSIKRLSLENINIASFPEDLFNNLHIKELSLFSFEVKDDSFQSNGSRLLFKGLETSLEQLMISRSFRRSQIKFLKLDHLKALIDIDFDSNIIPEVGNDWFLNGPKNLKFLFFMDNGIEKLGDRAFQSLEGLSILVVRGNIKTISRSMLPSQANKLRILDLKNNKLSEFPSDIFSNMPSLVEVNIMNNLFYTIQQDTWLNALPKLTKVSLQGNNLICDDRLKWVCNYRTDVIFGNCLAPADYRDKNVSQFCKTSH